MHQNKHSTHKIFFKKMNIHILAEFLKSCAFFLTPELLYEEKKTETQTNHSGRLE